MINLPNSNLLKRQRLSALLGLALDGSRLEGVVLRRTDGTLRDPAVLLRLALARSPDQ